VTFNFTPEELARYQAFLQYQQSGQPEAALASQSTTGTSTPSNSIPSSSLPSNSIPSNSIPSNSIPSFNSHALAPSVNLPHSSHILGVTPQPLSFQGSHQQPSQTAYSHPQPLLSQSQQIPPVPSITQLYQNTRAQQHGHPAAAA
jgi:hypothetical protein